MYTKIKRKILCCISISMMKHLQKPDWKSDLLWFHECLLISWLDTQTFPIVFNVECRVLSIFEGIVRSLFKNLSLWCLLFDCHQIVYQSNIGVWLRKRTTYDMSTLMYTTKCFWNYWSVGEGRLEMLIASCEVSPLGFEIHYNVWSYNKHF